MALKEYVGAIVLEVDGTEYEIESFDEDHKNGRGLVKPMSKTGRPTGYYDGVEEWDLKITAYVPKDDPPDWNAITGGKLTVYPVKESGKRITYSDCVSLGDSHKYQADGVAKVDVTLAACNKVEE